MRSAGGAPCGAGTGFRGRRVRAHGTTSSNAIARRSRARQTRGRRDFRGEPSAGTGRPRQLSGQAASRREPLAFRPSSHARHHLSRRAMSRIHDGATADLLSGARTGASVETLAEGATLMRGFAGPDAAALMAKLQEGLRAAPRRHMLPPRRYRMSVAMSNCGRAGWVTDISGYRYDPIDPMTRRPWPPMPDAFRRLAVRAAAPGAF